MRSLFRHHFSACVNGCGSAEKLAQEILYELNLNLVAAIGQNKKILSTVRKRPFKFCDSD